MLGDKYLKETVAKSIKDVIKRSRFDDLVGTIRAETGEPEQFDIEVHDLSALVLQLRIKTQRHGIHYYTVKISEML